MHNNLWPQTVHRPCYVCYPNRRWEERIKFKSHRTVAAQRRENYLRIKQTRNEKKSPNWYTKIEQQFNVLFMQIDFGNFLTLTQIWFVVCVFWYFWPVFNASAVTEITVLLLAGPFFFFRPYENQSVSRYHFAIIFLCFGEVGLIIIFFFVHLSMRFVWAQQFWEPKKQTNYAPLCCSNISSKNQRNDY